jgi:uncharacterized protein (DUF2384 family)
MTRKSSVPKAASAAQTTRSPQPPKKGAKPTVAIPKRIRELALQLIGTDRGADAWLTMPNPELSGQTPAELIAQGRADVVENFIEGNLHGNFG